MQFCDGKDVALTLMSALCWPDSLTDDLFLSYPTGDLGLRMNGGSLIVRIPIVACRPTLVV